MIIHGDCLEELRKLEADSVDSMVTDPPAGINFMNLKFDSDRGGKGPWIYWLTEIMREAWVVLKPGAHAFVWALPRTSHWTATALDDAGFEIRDVVTHLFGSGFPKSMDISKAIDKQAGAEREVIGLDASKLRPNRDKYLLSGIPGGGGKLGPDNGATLTAASTPEAKEWRGWGTALKPASEHWILCRKPILEKTVAKNVIKHGTGGINIDASRIGSDLVPSKKALGDIYAAFKGKPQGEYLPWTYTQGRFPANLLLSHNEDCVEVGMKKVKAIKGGNSTNIGNNVYGKYEAELDSKPCGFGDADGTETISAFECTPGCAVAMLDAQSLSGGMHSAGKARNGGAKQTNDGSLFGVGNHPGNGTRVGDSGGASRFFYCAKTSKSERNAGCEDLPEKECTSKQQNSDMRAHDGVLTNARSEEPKSKNHHPTVKPQKLMSYLITMITPPGGVCIDPFMGSGSTGVAAVKSGFQFIGIERERDYFDIAEKRIAHGGASYAQDHTTVE